MRNIQRAAFDHRTASVFAEQFLATAADGYIRLPLSRLSAMRFEHLGSDVDAEFLAELKEQALPASNAGFSEWASNTTPAVSLGWGWYIHDTLNRMLLAPDPVRSNVMLTDLRGYDLGPVATSHLFSAWLAGYDWQDNVSTALRRCGFL